MERPAQTALFQSIWNHPAEENGQNVNLGSWGGILLRSAFAFATFGCSHNSCAGELPRSASSHFKLLRGHQINGLTQYQSACFLLMTCEMVFLLLTLALPLLHLAQATTCQGESCTTGEFYLELNQQKHGLSLKSSMKIYFLLQVSSSAVDIQLKQALKRSQLMIPAATSLLFLAKVTSHLFILLPREIPPLPLCRRQRAAAGRVWRGRQVHQEVLHLLAQWAR